VLLLDSDYFIVPVACDLFSVRALSTLGQALKRWIIDWRTISSLAPDDSRLLSGTPRFLGYIPQRFKVYGQVMAKQPAHYLRTIVKRVHEDIIDILGAIDPSLISNSAADPVLGKVKDFASLVQLAQREGVSLWDCSSTYAPQKNEAEQSFRDIALTILDKTGSPGGRPKATRR
jgi:hypothetical protein